MDNRDRAAEVLAQDRCWIPGPGGMERFSVAEGADALADAGVLADDLPEPTRPMFPGGQVWYIEGPVGDVRANSTGQVVAFGTWQERPFRIVSTPDEALALARTLEAAADHAEKAAAHVAETLGDTDE